MIWIKINRCECKIWKHKDHRHFHSHKKRKDSLEGSLVRVLFAVKLEFPKILVPRLPQNASNVNIECTRKRKQLDYLCNQLLGALIYIHFIVLILMFLCNKWFLLFENNTRSLKLEEKYCYSYYSRQGDRWQFERAN